MLVRKKCPFCGSEMKRVGKVGDLGKGYKLPLVGDASKLMPAELRELDIWVCEGCGFVAFFKPLDHLTNR